ncbi:MAG: cytosine deaminase [Opitutus sp.]
MEPAGPAALGPGHPIDLEGRLVLAAFVDAHTHLDRAHTWCRAPNRRHSFGDALRTLAADDPRQTSADILLRADFALRSAWAHGTRLVRTHVVANIITAEERHTVMDQLRAAWQGRVELQSVALCGGADYDSARGEQLADIAVQHRAEALGGFFVMSPELPRRIERLLAIARERQIGIDLHVDENGDAASECLRVVAESVLRLQFDQPVVCGHCCSLSVQPAARQQETIGLVKRAGIGIIALPLCNLHLQDRRLQAVAQAPQWRGLAPILDLLEAGVPVACASDNVRDAFYPYGDLDALEVYVQSLRLAHLDANLGDSVRVVTTTAADLVGRPDLGRIAPGAAGRLVVFEARSFSELLSRPGAARRCIDHEDIHAPVPPDFSELRAAGLMDFTP